MNRETKLTIDDLPRNGPCIGCGGVLVVHRGWWWLALLRGEIWHAWCAVLAGSDGYATRHRRN